MTQGFCIRLFLSSALACVLLSTVAPISVHAAQSSAGATLERITVRNTRDHGFGSFRNALRRAMEDVAREIIIVEAIGTVALESALPTIDSDVTIRGPRNGPFELRRVSDQPFRILMVVSAEVSISRVQFTNGAATDGFGGGIRNEGYLRLMSVLVSGNSAVGNKQAYEVSGGGIYSSGRLKLLNSTVANNFVDAPVGDVDPPAVRGGGIYSEGILEVFKSTIDSNDAGSDWADKGGGLLTTGETHIFRSTLSRNTAHGGGGLLNYGRLTIVSSTIANNSVGFLGGGMYHTGNYLSLRASTVSGNSAPKSANLALEAPSEIVTSIVSQPMGGGSNCADDYLAPTSLGFNLSSDASCEFNQNTDAQHRDPLLKPLADYGGGTETMKLRPRSPAIDAGISAGLSADQRGFLRPNDLTDVRNAPGSDGSDIGAFERQSS